MNNMQVLIANSYYSDMPKGLQHEIYKAGFSEGKHSKTSNNHDVLVKRAKLLSGGTEHFVPEEWEMVGVEYRSHPVSCACGKANLKKSYTMKNRSTGYSLSVGGSCLKEYFKQDILGEAMEFLKKGTTGGEGYSWLGSKYDALILASLGFKKEEQYRAARSEKRPAPDEQVLAIRQMLTHDLSAFNSPMWHSKLLRGRRLLEFLKSSAERKRVTGREMRRLHHLEIHREALKRAPTVSPVYQPEYQTSSQVENRNLDIDNQDCFEGKEFYGSKNAIYVKNGEWQCDCGAVMTQWGSKGSHPYIVCDRCMNEFVADEAEIDNKVAEFNESKELF